MSQDGYSVYTHYTPGLYRPEVYAPEIYMPGLYTPGVYALEIYIPGIYAPEIYMPGVYTPGVYSAGNPHAGDLHAGGLGAGQKIRPVRHGNKLTLDPSIRPLEQPGPGGRSSRESTAGVLSLGPGCSPARLNTEDSGKNG